MENEKDTRQTRKPIFLTEEEKDRLVEFFEILIDIDQRNRVNKKLTVINSKKSET